MPEFGTLPSFCWGKSGADGGELTDPSALGESLVPTGAAHSNSRTSRPKANCGLGKMVPLTQMWTHAWLK